MPLECEVHFRCRDHIRVFDGVEMSHILDNDFSVMAMVRESKLGHGSLVKKHLGPVVVLVDHAKVNRL